MQVHGEPTRQQITNLMGVQATEKVDVKHALCSAPASNGSFQSLYAASHVADGATPMDAVVQDGLG